MKSLIMQSANRDSGSAILLCLIVLLVSSIAITAISKTILYRIGYALALKQGRQIHESWEETRAEAFKAALIDSKKFRPLKASSIFKTLVVPKEYQGVETIRLPLFKAQGANSYLWTLRDSECSASNNIFTPLLESNSFYTLRTCKKLGAFTSSVVRVRENLELDELSIDRALTLEVEGQVRIQQLTLKTDSLFELIAGGSVRIENIVFKGEFAQVLIHSTTGGIELTSLGNQELESCELPIRVSSNRATIFKDYPKVTSGCSSVTSTNPRWSKLIFLGELEQKSLIDSANLR